MSAFSRFARLTLPLACATGAHAQQSFHNLSAAQPSTGTFLLRQTAIYTEFTDDPSPLDREMMQLKLDTQLAYGLTRDLTVVGSVPLFYRETDAPGNGADSHDLHFGDAHVMLKHRFWQHDSGPIDTMRASLIVGLDFPTGEDPFGNGGWDPMIGAVFTSIQGRHGVNLAARYKFNTHESGEPVDVEDGIEDTFFLDTAYLYRLSPAQYAADTHGAWFAMAEVNGTYETNGDTELLLAPGIMYEARNWVFEAMVQFPIHEDIDHRPEREFALGLGFRVLF